MKLSVILVAILANVSVVTAQETESPSAIPPSVTDQTAASSQAEPSQAEPSQAEPSPAEPSQQIQNSLSGARLWLDKMAQATSTLNYQIAFVLNKSGEDTVPYLWRHAIRDDGLSMEQLNLQNGPGRELIRIGEVVSVFEPDVAPYSIVSGHITGPIPSELIHTPHALTNAYEFVLVGRARVAGRSAQQIRIVSRDNTRFNYQLWLDEETSMPLKLNMLDLQGVLLEQIQVTSLEILDQPPVYFSKINFDQLPEPSVITPRQPRQHNWVVNYLPQGMKEVRQDTRRLAQTGQIVEYKMLSDGLTDVSVYVQPAQQAIGSDLALRHGVTTFLSLTDGTVQVTVVGEIPLATAKAIATSLSAAQ